MSSPFLRALTATFLVLTSCASNDDDGPSPPAPETLFETLPAASPGKLRGVWQSTQTQPNGTVEVRIRFMERYAVGAARCLVTGSDAPVITGDSVELETTALDAATDKLTLGALALKKQEGNLVCQASLPGNTYDFTIEGETLTLSVGDAKLNTPLTKVGV
jgi:hypothetical protein